MRLLRRTFTRASNGATYDPEKFKQAQRTVTATDDIILDVMRNGYALIPVREKNKIRARLARENLRYRYTQFGGTSKRKLWNKNNLKKTIRRQSHY